MTGIFGIKGIRKTIIPKKKSETIIAKFVQSQTAIKNKTCENVREISDECDLVILLKYTREKVLNRIGRRLNFIRDKPCHKNSPYFFR